jgi:hypothetical protein
MLASHREEIRAHCLYPLVHLSFHHIIMSEVFSCEALLQYSTSVESPDTGFRLDGEWARYSQQLLDKFLLMAFLKAQGILLLQFLMCMEAVNAYHCC